MNRGPMRQQADCGSLDRGLRIADFPYLTIPLLVAVMFLLFSLLDPSSHHFVIRNPHSVQGNGSVNITAGSRYIPCHRTPTCRCAAVALPVPPLSPMICRFATLSPSRTLISERCI